MRIGELSQRAGVSRDTIRYYERRGLLPAAARPAPTNQYRSYAESDLLRLRLIRYAQGLGFTLSEVEPMLEPWVRGRATATAKRTALASKLAKIEARQRELEQIRTALTAQLDQLADE